MALHLEGGHTDSVLCCATTSEGKVLSGGEDGEICLWATNGQDFVKTTVESGDDVTSVCCANNNQHLVFVSGEEKLYEYDLRQLSEHVHRYDFNEEEINHIAINEKDEYLAACDDSGQIKIMRLQDRSRFKTLRKHTNICASVCFRPRRAWDLISGGYDKQLIQWDFSRGRSTCVIDIETVGPQTEPSVVNPPFIHSISSSASGKYLACGTENALVQVFNTSKRSPEFLSSLRAHTSGVSQVHFPKFHEAVLVSGGNDGQCFIWNVEHLEAAPVNGHGGEASAAAANHTADVATSFKVNIVHGEKINWISSGQTPNQKFFIVADNSNALTVYPFPEL